ncbi:MAG TPA: hypothetical protein VFZ95_14525 [Steroidobacteraceae bacterium]
MLGCIGTATAFAGEKVYFSEEDHAAHLAAAFSRAVSALPLDPKDGNQVRIWFTPYWSGRLAVTGYIVSGKGVYRCSASYNNDNGRYLVVNRGTCSGARNYPERLARALASIPELVKHKDHASCDTLDGGGAEIEGIVDGEKFHFTAMNSHDCDEAKPVAEILDLLSNSYYEKDQE